MYALIPESVRTIIRNIASGDQRWLLEAFIILHDISKHTHVQLRSDGISYGFHGHEEDIAQVLRKYPVRFRGKEIPEFLISCIENHGRPYLFENPDQLRDWASSLAAKGVKEDFKTIFEFYIAGTTLDLMASHVDDEGHYQEPEQVRKLAAAYEAYSADMASPLRPLFARGFKNYLAALTAHAHKIYEKKPGIIFLKQKEHTDPAHPEWLPCPYPITSVTPEDGQIGPIIHIREREALRIPLDEKNPAWVGSVDHWSSPALTARGIDANGKMWLVQWHFRPTSEDPALATQEFLTLVPEVLQGLQNLQVVLHLQQDSLLSMTQEEWKQRLGASDTRVIYRPKNFILQTLASKEGVGFFKAPTQNIHFRFDWSKILPSHLENDPDFTIVPWKKTEDTPAGMTRTSQASKDYDAAVLAGDLGKAKTIVTQEAPIEEAKTYFNEIVEAVIEALLKDNTLDLDELTEIVQELIYKSLDNFIDDHSEVLVNKNWVKVTEGDGYENKLIDLHTDIIDAILAEAIFSAIESIGSEVPLTHELLFEPLQKAGIDVHIAWNKKHYDDPETPVGVASGVTAETDSDFSPEDWQALENIAGHAAGGSLVVVDTPNQGHHSPKPGGHQSPALSLAHSETVGAVADVHPEEINAYKPHSQGFIVMMQYYLGYLKKSMLYLLRQSRPEPQENPFEKEVLSQSKDPGSLKRRIEEVRVRLIRNHPVFSKLIGIQPYPGMRDVYRVGIPTGSVGIGILQPLWEMQRRMKGMWKPPS